MNTCIKDSSVSCPFRSCIAGSVEACNYKSGRFTSRSTKAGHLSRAVLSGKKFSRSCSF